MSYKQIDIPKTDLIEILKYYSLSPVNTYPLYLGMDNINIKVLANDGNQYVLKICSAPTEVVYEHLKIMIQCGSPEQQPLKTISDSLTFSYDQRIGYLLPFIEGKDLLEESLTEHDIQIIAQFRHHFAKQLADIPEKPTPNIWDLSHFYNHLAKYKKFIHQNWAIPHIEFNQFNQVTVHNDFTRSNLLRKTNGELHLLDYGDVSYGYQITDLAVSLAHFCVEDTPIDRVLPYSALFLKTEEIFPQPHLLYQLMKLRFIQAIVLTLFEEEQFGIHPRGEYWLNFGTMGLERFNEIQENDFVKYIASIVAKNN